ERGQRATHGPRIYLQDARELQAAHVGAQRVVGHLDSGNAEPLTIAAADFDEDGYQDLAVSYQTLDGGAIAIHRGNHEAFASKTELGLQEISKERFPSPFLEESKVLAVPFRPDFLAVGRFSPTGHTDLLAASRGGRAMYLLPGDGRGGFAPAQKIDLPGSVTML